MGFYEFTTNEFAYYALIGAKNMDEAQEYYDEVIGDIDREKEIPKEITEIQAREKLLSICKTDEEKQIANAEFEENIKGNEPYLILVDRCLL